MTTKRVLVTGGGGFLGGAIVRLLLSDGITVRSFSRGQYAELEALGVEQVQGDLTDAQAVRRACRDVEAVFHVAARAGVWGKYAAFYGPNVLGTENIIQACREAGVQRLIYTSSPSVVFGGMVRRRVGDRFVHPFHIAAAEHHAG